jgi:hypothetical protein
MVLEPDTMKYYYWSDVEKFFIEQTDCDESDIWDMWLGLFEDVVKNDSYCTHWFDITNMNESEFCGEFGYNGSKFLTALGVLKEHINADSIIIYYNW